MSLVGPAVVVEQRFADVSALTVQGFLQPDGSVLQAGLRVAKLDQGRQLAAKLPGHLAHHLTQPKARRVDALAQWQTRT